MIMLVGAGILSIMCCRIPALSRNNPPGLLPFNAVDVARRLPIHLHVVAAVVVV